MKGAETNIEDVTGKTPIDIAKSLKCDDDGDE